MARQQAKGKGSKNELQSVRQMADRSSVREAFASGPELLAKISAPFGLEVNQHGTPAQRQALESLESDLARARIHYLRKDYRPDAISLFVTVPGQRWEVDVTEDGSIEWELFKSEGSILEEDALKTAIRDFAEPDETADSSKSRLRDARPARSVRI